MNNVDDLEGKKEYIASLNDPKAFEAVNLGTLERTRVNDEHKKRHIGYNVIRKMFLTEYRAYKKYRTGDHLISLIYHYFNLHKSNFPFTIKHKDMFKDSRGENTEKVAIELIEEDCSKCEHKNTKECTICLQIKGSPHNRFEAKAPEPITPEGLDVALECGVVKKAEICPKCDSYDKTTKKCRANLDMEKIDCWGYTTPLGKLIDEPIENAPAQPGSDKFREYREKIDELWEENMIIYRGVAYNPELFKIVKREEYPKVVYQLGTDSKEYIELRKSFDGLISEFKSISDRIVIQIKAKYGKTAKGSEYLENLFKEELNKLEARRD